MLLQSLRSWAKWVSGSEDAQSLFGDRRSVGRRPLEMYELVILGFLMRMPYHGYLIAKIINDMIGPFARLSNGRLYPLLAKLEQEGLISPAPEEAVPAPLRSER